MKHGMWDMKVQLGCALRCVSGRAESQSHVEQFVVGDERFGGCCSADSDCAANIAGNRMMG